MTRCQRYDPLESLCQTEFLFWWQIPFMSNPWEQNCAQDVTFYHKNGNMNSALRKSYAY